MNPAQLFKEKKFDECISALLSEEVEMPDRSMYTDDELALVDSIKNNNVAKCEQLLNKGTRTDIYDEQGFCLLNACIEAVHFNECSIDIFNLLVKKCNVNDGNFHDKEPPIQLATFFREERLMKILLEAGANPNQQDSAGFTSFDFVSM